MKNTALLSIIFMIITMNAPAQGWKELGTGSNALNANNRISTICADGKGNVYAAGDFTDSFKNLGNNYVAVWNGTNWDSLGPGSDAIVKALSSQVICTDSAGDLYVGGAQPLSGVDYITVWNGIYWTWLGNKPYTYFRNNGDQVLAICKDKAGNIYASGTFTDNKGYTYVNQWNGSSWSQLGPDTIFHNVAIWVLCTDKFGNLYAAGDFYDGSAQFYVAKWDGKAWSKVGTTGSNALHDNKQISSMCTDSAGNLYVTGFFTNSSGKYYVAKWDGKGWNELGSGNNALNADSLIYAICTDPAGNVYAAGNFVNASGKRYVAQWDGKSWGELGAGKYPLNANSYIVSICSDKAGHIFAAGNFSDGNGKQYVAQYDAHLGIEALAQPVLQNAEVYPNPAGSNIILKTNDIRLYHTSFFISDIIGRSIMQGKIETEKTKINIAGWQRGVYFLHITGSAGAYKIIKE